MTRRPRRARTFLSLESLEARLCLSALPVGASTTPPGTATQAHLTASYGQLPLSFEVNKGQANPRVNFLTQGAGYSASLTPTGAVLSLGQGTTNDQVTVRIVGASSGSRVVGLDKQAGVSNYLIGNDPSKWHTHIANYGEVAYQGVYRGIDLVYHGNQNHLEYDFVVKPGASPGAIRLAFDGIQRKALDSQGNLILHTSGGDVVEHAPVAYQMVDGVRHAVTSRFVLGHAGQVGFQVGHYDHSKPLVIDPTLSYSTYLGANQEGYAIAVDPSGNAYVTGYRYKGGAYVAFVTKFNATGTGLVYSTYVGSTGASAGTSIALFTDSSHNTFAYLTGYTDSTTFPTKNGLQTKIGGGQDAFLTKLSANGSSLVYSTYLGGSSSEGPSGISHPSGGIAVDGAGNAYLTGFTTSTNFPVTAGAYQPTFGGGIDAFVTKINPSQVGNASLVYSTYLGGSNYDYGYGIAVDHAGDAYVTGSTFSTNFPVTPGAFQAATTGGIAFVTKLSSTGSGLVYSTLLGGTSTVYADDATAYGIAINNSGNAYVTGYTTGSDFPTTLGAYQRTFNASGRDDAFMTELNLDGSDLVYSTYLGGSEHDRGRGIAVDGSGNAYITGMVGSYVPSTGFPVKNAFQSTFHGGYANAFVTKLNPLLSGAASLVYSTYLGGSLWDEGRGIAVDGNGNGNAYVTGSTESPDFPIQNAFQPKLGKSSLGWNAFVTKITAS